MSKQVSSDQLDSLPPNLYSLPISDGVEAVCKLYPRFDKYSLYELLRAVQYHYLPKEDADRALKHCIENHKLS